jgi:hypothetical protein
MAKISNTGSYPIVNASSDDLIVITDKSDNDATKNITVGSIQSGGTMSYNVYSALLTQQSTQDPEVVSLFENSTGATLTWRRVTTGFYTLTADSPIFDPATKVQIWINYGFPTNHNAEQPKAKVSQPDLITVETGANGNISDDILEAAPFEIRIYS